MMSNYLRYLVLIICRFATKSITFATSVFKNINSRFIFTNFRTHPLNNLRLCHS